MSWRSLRILTLRRDQAELDPVCQLERNQIDKLIVEMESLENVAKATNQSVKNLSRQVLRAGRLELAMSNDLVNQAKIVMNDDLMSSLLDECNSFAYMGNASNNDFIISLQKTIMEPLRLLKRAMFEVRAELRIYNSLEMRLVKVQRKIAACNDKTRTGSNLVRLQEMKLELAMRKNEFSKATQQLVSKLSKFLSSCLELLNSCVKGFIAAELAWIQASKKAAISSFSGLPTEIKTDRVKSIGNSMRALDSLSICLDPK